MKRVFFPALSCSRWNKHCFFSDLSQAIWFPAAGASRCKWVIDLRSPRWWRAFSSSWVAGTLSWLKYISDSKLFTTANYKEKRTRGTSDKENNETLLVQVPYPEFLLRKYSISGVFGSKNCGNCSNNRMSAKTRTDDRQLSKKWWRSSSKEVRWLYFSHSLERKTTYELLTSPTLRLAELWASSHDLLLQEGGWWYRDRRMDRSQDPLWDSWDDEAAARCVAMTYDEWSSLRFDNRQQFRGEVVQYLFLRLTWCTWEEEEFVWVLTDL